MRRGDRQPFIQLLAELAHLLCLFLHLGLAPMAGQRAGERQEGGRAADDDAIARGALPQLHIRFQRGGDEIVAGDIHDDEVGRLGELLPIGLAAERVGMGAHGAGMVGEIAFAGRAIDLIDGVQIGFERAFDVDHQLLVAGQADDEVGAQAAILHRHRHFLLEVDEGGEAGGFDEVLELLFAPAPPGLGRGAERIDQLGRFLAHLALPCMDHGDRLAQFGIAADPILLDPGQPLFIALERGFDRIEQGPQLRLAFFMGLGEALVGAGEELGLGGFEQAAANLAELGGELVLGVLERGDLLFEGVGAGLDVGLERGEVAQRDFAFGLDRVEALGGSGLHLAQALVGGDLRGFQPGDLTGGLGDALLFHRQLGDGAVALGGGGFELRRQVGLLRHQRRGRARAQPPADGKPDQQRDEEEKSGRKVHQKSLLGNETGT